MLKMPNTITILRIFVYALLLASFSAASWASYQAFYLHHFDYVNIFAGSSAILTASISALIAFRSAELTEERLRPYPYPYIDLRSRLDLAQLRIKNVGGTAAHDIYLEWTGNSIPKKHEEKDGTDIPLLAYGKENAISILLPYESISEFLDSAAKISEQAKVEDTVWKGFINFKDARGQRHRNPFIMDMKNFRRGLTYDTEEPKTMRELQKLPKKISELTEAVKAIKNNY